MVTIYGHLIAHVEQLLHVLPIKIRLAGYFERLRNIGQVETNGVSLREVGDGPKVPLPLILNIEPLG